MKMYYKNIVIVITAILWVGICSCTESVKESIPEIIYSIRPKETDGITMIQIDMSFKAEPSGITKLSYQDNAWGEENLYNAIDTIYSRDERLLFFKNPDSNFIVIKHPKELRKLDITYVLKQDFENEINSNSRYRPVINEYYFHIFSHNLFMLPYAEEENPNYNINLNWVDFPETFMIHNSFGSDERIQVFENITEEKFHSAIFVGGDFRIYKKDIQGNSLVLATRGDWIPFTDQEVFDLLYTTVSAQRSFWQDHSQKYFTVTMLPFPQERGSSFGGTGLTNSFATSVSNNEETSLDQLAYLFNHELMHNWIGHTIKNDAEEAQYWFSEGFTEYYTFKNIARNHINGLDKKYYVEQLNSVIKSLYGSPVADKPNSEINYENFWSDSYYEKLPYHRGALFAFILDLKIQQESDNKYSLDDVMRKILEDSKQDLLLNDELFINAVNKFTKADYRPFFNMHINEGKLLDLKSIFNELNLDYLTEAQVFDQGFVSDKDTKIVTKVISGSAAEKAGLQVGDKLTFWSIYRDNIEKEIELKVIREGKELFIHYLPIKKVSLVQLLTDDRNLERTKI